MDKELIATSRNGKNLWLDPKNSHAATHLDKNPKLREYIKEIIADFDLTGSLYHEFDMGREVGYTDLVETTNEDEIVYAKRLNRDTYTRFAKNRDATPTMMVTLVVTKVDEDNYDLISSWIGPKVPGFPGDPKETPDSREFWLHHALIWGNQPVQEGTETNELPW